MSKTDVLLIEKVAGLGGEGDRVKVKSGYARNFLFPRGIGIPVTTANRKWVETLQARRAEREAKELADAQEFASKIQSLSLAFPVKTGKGGKVFGSVSSTELHKRLEEEGIEVAKKQLSLPLPAKKLGKHTARIKLHAEVVVELTFEVVSENPIEE